MSIAFFRFFALSLSVQTYIHYSLYHGNAKVECLSYIGIGLSLSGCESKLKVLITGSLRKCSSHSSILFNSINCNFSTEAALQTGLEKGCNGKVYYICVSEGFSSCDIFGLPTMAIYSVVIEYSWGYSCKFNKPHLAKKAGFK